jgi:HxlR-like helix-turn-helix
MAKSFFCFQTLANVRKYSFFVSSELEKGGILERHRYNEIPPRVEYTLTNKGQELVESVVSILLWMRRLSISFTTS